MYKLSPEDELLVEVYKMNCKAARKELAKQIIERIKLIKKQGEQNGQEKSK